MIKQKAIPRSTSKEDWWGIVETVHSLRHCQGNQVSLRLTKRSMRLYISLGMMREILILNLRNNISLVLQLGAMRAVPEMLHQFTDGMISQTCYHDQHNTLTQHRTSTHVSHTFTFFPVTTVDCPGGIPPQEIWLRKSDKSLACL